MRRNSCIRDPQGFRSGNRKPCASDLSVLIFRVQGQLSPLNIMLAHHLWLGLFWSVAFTVAIRGRYRGENGFRSFLAACAFCIALELTVSVLCTVSLSLVMGSPGHHRFYWERHIRYRHATKIVPDRRTPQHIPQTID